MKPPRSHEERVSSLLSTPSVLSKPSPAPLTQQNVANYIATEYSRTAVIAHISQATAGTHEGWGRPGTKWDGTHFRTFILDTLPEMRESVPRRPMGSCTRVACAYSMPPANTQATSSSTTTPTPRHLSMHSQQRQSASNPPAGPATRQAPSQSSWRRMSASSSGRGTHVPSPPSRTRGRSRRSSRLCAISSPSKRSVYPKQRGVGVGSSVYLPCPRALYSIARTCTH